MYYYHLVIVLPYGSTVLWFSPCWDERWILGVSRKGILDSSNTIGKPNPWETDSRCSIMQTQKIKRKCNTLPIPLTVTTEVGSNTRSALAAMLAHFPIPWTTAKIPPVNYLHLEIKSWKEGRSRSLASHMAISRHPTSRAHSHLVPGFPHGAKTSFPPTPHFNQSKL